MTRAYAALRSSLSIGSLIMSMFQPSGCLARDMGLPLDAEGAACVALAIWLGPAGAVAGLGAAPGPGLLIGKTCLTRENGPCRVPKVGTDRARGDGCGLAASTELCAGSVAKGQPLGGDGSGRHGGVAARTSWVSGR